MDEHNNMADIKRICAALSLYYKAMGVEYEENLFYNYMGFYSVILMALVNSNYEFMYINVGANGSDTVAPK